MSSLLNKVFRKRKQEASTSQDAIDKLREMENLLVKKQLHLEEKIEKEVEAARRYGKRNQRQALAALKRKKIHENELSRIDAVLLKLDGQRTSLENAGMNMEVMKVLEQTTKALQVANDKLDIDKVSDLMDRISEGLDDANEVSTAISQPVGDVVDKEDLMQELLDLVAEDSTASPEVAALPEVPAGPITRSKSREIERMSVDMVPA